MSECGWTHETVFLNPQCVTKLCTRMCRSDMEFGVVATHDVRPEKTTVCDGDVCTKTQVCTAGCNVEIIEGTKLLADHEDAKLYGDVQIAVTPIDENDVTQKNKSCGWPVNIVAHTHPEFIQGASQSYALLSPPSLGDLFAHAILANYRNYKENGCINTFLVFAAEGVYMYGVTPTRFREVAHQFEAEAEADMAGLPANHPTRRDFAVGNLPDATYERRRGAFFEEHRKLNDAFFAVMIKTCQLSPMFRLSQPKMLATAKHWEDGAHWVGPDLNNGNGFDAMVRNPTPEFQNVVEGLVGPRSRYAKDLIEKGLFCVFYPLAEFVSRPLPVVISVPPPNGDVKF